MGFGRIAVNSRLAQMAIAVAAHGCGGAVNGLARRLIGRGFRRGGRYGRIAVARVGVSFVPGIVGTDCRWIAGLTGLLNCRLSEGLAVWLKGRLTCGLI